MCEGEMHKTRKRGLKEMETEITNIRTETCLISTDPTTTRRTTRKYFINIRVVLTSYKNKYVLWKTKFGTPYRKKQILTH